MSSIEIILTLQAPTCISDHPTSPGQVTTTLGYITGTAIRGSMAGRWLGGRRVVNLDGTERHSFERIFRHGGLRFRPGWPVANFNTSHYRTWVVPTTAWTTKRRGGWRIDPGYGESYVTDALVHLLRDHHEDRELLDGLEPISGGFAVRVGNATSMQSIAARRRMISRSATRVPGSPPGSPHRGVAAAGQLHAFETLETRERFRCVVSGPDDLLEELEQRVLGTGTRLRLGRRRSAGDGAAEVTSVAPVEEEDRNVNDLADVARSFSARANAPRGMIYLPVTLESDMLLRDAYLLPCSSGDPQETLARYSATIPTEMALRLAIQNTRWIGGWDMIRGIPRPPRLAVSQGSVWVYSVPTEALEQSIGWWLEAERTGIGETRDHGFGMVRLLHPLHAEEVEKW